MPTRTRPPRQRTNHLLAIGIDEYTNGITKLNNAVSDTKAFIEVLTTNYQFNPLNITTLYNKDATKSAILNAFDDLLTRLTAQDNLIIYFSGHGELHKITQRGYWIPADAKVKQRATYLSNQEVIDFFKHCNAHHIFGIVDSCFSGTLFETKSISTASERLRNIPSRWLLTAGRKELVSDGSLGTASPFAKTLITHLQGNESMELWVSDLSNRVLQGFKYQAEQQTPRAEPLHGVGHMGGQFVFYKKDYIPQAPSVITPPPNSNPNKNIDPPAPIVDTAIPTDFLEWKDYLREKVVNDLKKVLDILSDQLSRSSNYRNQIFLQESRYNRTTDKLNKGMLLPQQGELTFVQITKIVLEIIDDLEEEDLKA